MGEGIGEYLQWWDSLDIIKLVNAICIKKVLVNKPLCKFDALL